MISYDDIRQLQQYSSANDSLTLSLYINTDQSKAANLNRGFETVVENEFRTMVETHQQNNHARERLEAECQRVLQFLKDYTPKARSLVIFSDSQRGLWWHRDLQVEIPQGVRWSPQPWVRPLLEVIEEDDRVAAVLIDKQHARIVTVDATGVEHQAEFVSDVPNRHATTGTDHIWSQGQMERDHDNHLKSHAKRVADELGAIVDRRKLTRVVIGGPVEATTAFTNELGKRIQQMVIGTLSIPIDASDDRVVKEISDVRERIDVQNETRLVESMVTSAMKGDRAVLGIGDTLGAIQQGRVYCMVVARDYRTQGKQCISCQTLSLEAEGTCSFCGGTLEPALDLINRASHRVLDQGGKVQVVSGAAAEKLGGAGIGAVLRF
jgi:hypothetical protein